MNVEGYPYPGVTVYIEGAAPVVTDADGAFTIEGVTPPYDVYLARAAASAGTLYVGLERPDPVLDALFGDGHSDTATLEGSLVAGDDSTFEDPVPDDRVTRFLFATSRGTSTRSSTSGLDLSPFGFELTWGGDGSWSGTVHALQIERSEGGAALDYHGYGTETWSGVDDGETHDLGDIEMNPVDSRSVQGSITVDAPDYSIASVASAVSFAGSDATLSLTYVEVPLVFFALPFPDVAGATAHISVIATPDVPMGDAGILVHRANIPLSTSVAITVPDTALPLAVSPAEGATAIEVGATLDWAPVEDAVHVVMAQPSGTPGAAAIAVVTAEDTAEIPDFSPFGVALGDETDYEWRTIAFVGYTTTDELAEPHVIRRSVTQRMDAVLAIGAPRTFTTD